ncbi:hypothetical protein JG688_00016076 [Phytophthora aleatoria]|uniref:Uncharacterized protein n=1 Tax=Phytophthora aleatoria TaxID=2496075 RepID=A0A8J5IJ97_9STRA|nr:hypothetical protein JG688_00016076 [Phytophthora aleatoria]
MKLLADTHVIHVVCKQPFAFLLASVIHHERYLRQVLFPNHPIFKARVFSTNTLLQQLRGATVLAIGESLVSGMKATGLPPYLAVAKKLSQLQEQLAAIRSEMEILKTNMANSIPNEVASKPFVVNGVVPVSLRDIDMRIDTLRAELSSEFRQTVSSVQNIIDRGPSGSAMEEIPVWRSWIWSDGEIIHSVPIDWEFPLDRPQHHMRHSRVKIVMEFMQKFAEEPGVLPTGVTKITELDLPTVDKLLASSSTRCSQSCIGRHLKERRSSRAARYTTVFVSIGRHLGKIISNLTQQINQN